MDLAPFRLERFFAAHEFRARFLFSASDCESLTLQEVLALADGEGTRLWRELSLGYTETAGHPLLRAEVAALTRSVGPDGVVVAAPEEAIFLAMHALLQPGDRVVVLAPAYQSLHEVARSIGCRVDSWPLQRAGDGWRLDLELLGSLLAEPTRLLVVNFPHNPTGFQPRTDEWAAVLEAARRCGAWVFADEMYRLLEFDETDRLEPACDLYERAVSLSGLSKAFALPGLRIGWLATRQSELVQRLLALKDFTTICSGAPSEILALIALRARERILLRNRGIVAANLAQAGAFFAGHADQFSWLPPRAGPVACACWQGKGDVDAFCRDLLAECGVMIVPGGLFDLPGGYFRVGLGRRNLPEALTELATWLETRDDAVTT